MDKYFCGIKIIFMCLYSLMNLYVQRRKNNEFVYQISNRIDRVSVHTFELDECIVVHHILSNGKLITFHTFVI